MTRSGTEIVLRKKDAKFIEDRKSAALERLHARAIIEHWLKVGYHQAREHVLNARQHTTS